MEFIVRWFEWVWTWFAPRTPGRHARVRSIGMPQNVRVAPPGGARTGSGRAAVVVWLDGDDQAMVRPYVLAHERRRAERQHRQRAARCF